MANYNGYTRTNYFRVKDESRLRELVNGLSSDDDVTLWDEIADNGDKYFAFGAYGTLYYYDEETDVDNTDAFYDEIMKIIHEEDACIITEVGHEKLRYLEGYAVIITSKTVDSIDLESAAIDKSRELLNNDKYSPKTSY